MFKRYIIDYNRDIFLRLEPVLSDYKFIVVHTKKFFNSIITNFNLLFYHTFVSLRVYFNYIIWDNFFLSMTKTLNEGLPQNKHFIVDLTLKCLFTTKQTF